MSVYRIVQEALANAVRHAAARSIRIEFGTTGERLDRSRSSTTG